MKRLLFLLILIVAGFTACTKFNDLDNPHYGLVSISLKDTMNMYVGQVRYPPIATNPTSYNLDSLSYTSSDTSILVFSDVYKLTAKRVGITTITISNLAKTISVNCVVTVTPAPVDSLKIGLIAYYPFNNSVADSSGNRNDGTPYNLTSTTNRFGIPNSAYYFNGTNSYVTVEDTRELRLATSDITFSAWVKLDSYGSSFGSNILTKHFTGNDQGWAWGITGYEFNPFGVVTYGPGGASASARGTIVVDTLTWHMVTSVYDRPNQKVNIYIDGILDAEQTGVPSPKGTINAIMCIGRDNPGVSLDGYFVHGSLDEVRIYNRPLTAVEVNKLYNLSK